MKKIRTRKLNFKNFNIIKFHLIKITLVSKGLEKFFLNNKIYNNNLLTYIFQQKKGNIGYNNNTISILDLCLNLNSYLY